VPYNSALSAKSSKLFGIKNIPCKDVHSCVSTNILENHNKTIDGFYACSYIKRDLIGLNISQDMYDIAIRNGVIHEKDYVKIFNIILNKHRFDYMVLYTCLCAFTDFDFCRIYFMAIFGGPTILHVGWQNPF
jgi:hypothetical protein